MDVITANVAFPWHLTFVRSPFNEIEAVLDPINELASPAKISWVLRSKANKPVLSV